MKELKLPSKAFFPREKESNQKIKRHVIVKKTMRITLYHQNEI